MINPTTHAITEFAIPTAKSNPEGITAGPDGNVWFTEQYAGKIGMINLATYAITEFAMPSSSNPTGITAGPDGNLWFTETEGCRVYRDDQSDDPRHLRVRRSWWQS